MQETEYEICRRWWNAKAHKEETDDAEQEINRALRWREIERHLEGVKTILDVGGATGAFSIPLAKRGFEVTHLDLSPSMLDLARQRAEGIESIRFVEGNATDLSRYADRSFDLVLNMDGAISFCGAGAEQAIRESCRVAGRKVILSVSNRVLMAALWVQASLAETGTILPCAYEMMDKGIWRPDQFPENALLMKENTMNYFPPLKAFLVSELRMVLEGCGMHVLRCGGIGSLAGLAGPEVVKRARENVSIFAEFLDICECYDREIAPEGPGTRERAGLLAVAECTA